MSEGVYELYWRPSTASLAPMAALEETGARYLLREVELDEKRRATADYRSAIHPLGLVPALRLPQGRLMWDAAGIMIYLADLHPKAGLAPATGSLEHAHYCQWMSWGASMLSPEYKRYYIAHRYVARAEDEAAMQARAIEILDSYWAVVEDAVSGQAWMAGEVFSGADYFIAMYRLWYPDQAAFARQFPEVTRICEAAGQRPAMAKALATHEH